MTDAQKRGSWRGSEDVWLRAAYEMLVETGVESVKILPLASRLGLSRTSFYHHFQNRDELLLALIRRWQAHNTGNLVARTERYAETIGEAVFNLFDCWIDPGLFDSRLEFAIRNWAQRDPALQATLDQADTRRIRAISAMFLKFGFTPETAETRARTLYYTQVGYIAMAVDEPLPERILRMPSYVEVFTGKPVSPEEKARFLSRNGL